MRLKIITAITGLFIFPALSSAQVSFTANPTNGCLPLTVNFTNTSSLPPSTYYIWNFGTGPSQNSVNATYTYTWQGNYNVTLNAFDTTGGGMNFIGSYTLPGGINASGSQLYYTTDTICPGENVEMYLYPYGNNTQWDFGDGNTSAQQQPTHSYFTTGTYTVTVTANTSCGLQTITHQFVVMNNATPNAYFNSGSPVCPGDLYQFYPQNYQAASYQWDFGDGNTSTESQPAHAWAAPGNYPVTLLLTSTCGTTDTYTDTVSVQNNIYINNWVQLFQSADTVCPGDPVYFDYNINETMITIWSFGNGDSLFVKNPNYAYPATGSYTVSLYLENGCGNDTILTTSIFVTNGLPFTGYAQMDANPNPVCPGDVVNFYSSQAFSYAWDFGDGNNSTLQQPTHSYTSTGNYVATLILTNGCGNSAALTDTINVNNSVVPVLNSGGNGNWGSPSGSFCPGDSAVFYAMGGTSYLWDFGDGNSTTQTTPVTITDGNNTFTVDIAQHAYSSAGTYIVTLTLFNSCGNSATDSMMITVDTNGLVNGDFVITGTEHTACAPVEFLSLGGNNYEWDFGDGDTAATSSGTISHVYAAPGNYNVSVIITNGCGNSATYSENITIDGMIPSIVSATPASCNYNNDGATEITVTGGTAPYTFSMDGGAAQGTGIFVNLSPGTHTAEITDANGCITTIVSTVTAPSPLAVNFSTVNSSCGNADGSATATVSGGTAGYAYNWSGGGNAATENNLSAGTYQLTVTDANNCTIITTVAVNDNGGPAVTYPTVYSPVCQNETAFMLSGGSPAGGSYSGVGVTGGNFDPALAGLGTHTIIYTYTAGGCTSSASQTITVNGLPQVMFNNTFSDVCLSASSFTLTGGTPAGGNYSGIGVSAGIFDPATAGAGTHAITYSFTDANSCTNNATVTVTVIEVTFDTTYSPVCIDNGPVVLSGGSPAGGSYSGNGVAAGMFDPSAAGAGIFTISYTYSSGSCTTTDNLTITVNGLPSVDYTVSYPVMCTNGPDTTLNGATPAGGIYTGTGVTGGVFSPSAAGAGTFTITYTYTDGNGCSNSDTATITVDACLGTTGNEELIQAEIYPNPFSTDAVIKINDPKPGTVFNLFDANGKSVLSFGLQGSVTVLKNEDIVPGLYFYTINCYEKPVAKGKIVIVK